jgi:peptide/nickel transport system substrate-binding protein
MPAANDMKRYTSVLPAIVSVAAAVASVDAARPRYGGTLRVQMQTTIRSLDPSASSPDVDRVARVRVQALAFETLTIAHPNGGLRPALATAWEHDARDTVWRLHLRAGVMLHGGSPLQPWHVASALRAANPQWKVATDGDTLVVDIDRPNPDLPWELADVRNAVVVRSPGGDPAGTGPFRLERLDAKRLSLRAHDEYWGGRPFLDAVQIDMGVATTDLVSNLELGRSDMAPIAPIDVRRLAQRSLQIASSRPLVTYALVFEPPRAVAAAEPIRRTIALAIDRQALHTVVLQRHGAPATMLVPAWLTGYASIVAPGDRGMSRAAISALPLEQRVLTLRVDAADPLAQALADRIAVDVRETGLTMKLQAPVGLAARPDVRLVRLDFTATSPDRALAFAMSALGPRVVALATSEPAPPGGAPVDGVYRVERALLERFIVVPVVHVPEMYAISDRVAASSGTPVLANGAWNIANVWLRTEQPARR